MLAEVNCGANLTFESLKPSISQVVLVWN